MNDITLRPCHAGAVECRICGLKFLPELKEDRDRHEQEHRRLLWGGLPYDIREFMKSAAHAVLHNKDGLNDSNVRRRREIAKRTIVFAWWARAVAKGISPDDFEPFMAEHLAHLDANRPGNQRKSEQRASASGILASLDSKRTGNQEEIATAHEAITLLHKCDGVVECRICGLKFCPDLEEDRELHEQEHLRLVCGGLPYDVREFVKAAGWEAAECPDGVQGDHARRAQEIAKRAVAFSYWTRATSNGIPENDFEPYMAAHLAFVDATVDEDEERIADADEAMARWQQYG